MKPAYLEFGGERLELRVPDNADILCLPPTSLLADPDAAVRQALEHPVGARPLAAIVAEKRAAMRNPAAVIVVSDNTRPVPYKGAGSILEPLINILRRAGVENITVLVATGTHRVLERGELEKFLPPAAFVAPIRTVCHDCLDRECLRMIGTTARGTRAVVNAGYLDADIKILTGLVEPHFMAGYSGGRKSICPGLVGQETTYGFHGPALMADPGSDSLVLAGNPCHEESLAVARMAGCDFIVNVTIDHDRRLTGVFAGDMEEAHLAATRKACQTNRIAIEHEYDLVISHAGFVGINHYQAAKAGCEAIKAVKPGGRLIMLANHTDRDPVGSGNYKQALRLLKTSGHDEFTATLFSDSWQFIPEQWEAQMWARVLRKLEDEQNLVYCCPQLSPKIFGDLHLPGVCGPAADAGGSDRDRAEGMVQGAIDAVLAADPCATCAVLTSGPYGVPGLRHV